MSNIASDVSQAAPVFLVNLFYVSRVALAKTVQEHPYGILFVLIFFVLLWPLTSFIVVGSLALAIAAVVTLVGSLTLLLPVLVSITVLATVIWMVSVVSIAAYRRMGVTKMDSSNRHKRWKLFASTLEKDVRSVEVTPAGTLAGMPGLAGLEGLEGEGGESPVSPEEAGAAPSAAPSAAPTPAPDPASPAVEPGAETSTGWT